MADKWHVISSTIAGAALTAVGFLAYANYIKEDIVIPEPSVITMEKEDEEETEPFVAEKQPLDSRIIYDVKCSRNEIEIPMDKKIEKGNFKHYGPTEMNTKVEYICSAANADYQIIKADLKKTFEDKTLLNYDANVINEKVRLYFVDPGNYKLVTRVRNEDGRTLDRELIFEVKDPLKGIVLDEKKDINFQVIMTQYPEIKAPAYLIDMANSGG